MLLQNCIKFGKTSMTWAVDDELSPHTYWYCSECKDVVAWEDETKQRDCIECSSENGQIFIWTRDEVFWCYLNRLAKSPYSGEKLEGIELK